MPRPSNPEGVRVILATDCGSTTTKAILIQKVDGHYRQTHRGEAPSTVEEPFADVTIGVNNAVTEVGELAGRRFFNDEGRLIQPASGSEGCDLYISTSSAGGGLQMVVAGVVQQMTAASAKRAALGAGAIVMDVLASNDRRRPHEKIQRIRELRPDMILISGGTDGGTTTHVLEIAELIAPARPQPRFGGAYRMPVIFAGNRDAAPLVEGTFDDSVDLSIVANLRPVLEQENLGPARDKIHDLFLEHVMAHAPGYDKLMTWTDAPIMPTPGAVGNILRTIAEGRGLNAVGVDIGGATTDVFSVFDGTFNRTVSANLGMSYSISNVCAEATMPNILRWVHFDMDERELRNRVKNKMIRPTTIPQSLDALIFEQAVAREALRLAYEQHKEFATTLRGVQQQRTVGDTFTQQTSGQSIVDNMKLDLLVASGGVLSHAPRMHQTAMLLIDAFQPEGITLLAKDSIFMMPHLGVLSQVHPQAAMEVFERDCLIYLGTCAAAKGTGKQGRNCFSYSLQGDSLDESGELKVGEIRLLPLPSGKAARLTIEPERGFDLGAGAGRALESEVRGGTVGLILDARGRPSSCPRSDRAPAAPSRDGSRRSTSTRRSNPSTRGRHPSTPGGPPQCDERRGAGATMAHAYTPGLKVTPRTRYRCRRMLPVRGQVLVGRGDRVRARDVVARAFMPGEITPLNLANLLSLPPSDVPECTLKKVGDAVETGEILARTKGIFGLFKNEVASKVTGTIETVSPVTGQVIVRGAPEPLEVLAYLAGEVVEVLADEGCVIEADATFVQGIFGIGPEAFGPIHLACSSPAEELTPERISSEMAGAVVVGGSRLSHEAIERAQQIGAAAVVSGGIDDQDLKEILGYDLGVAITGTETIGLTIIVTEGFGAIDMAERTFEVLRSREGAQAAVNGATQIRAGVMRPEIVVPCSDPQGPAATQAAGAAGQLDLGRPVRIIRDPYFGRIGTVGSLPPEPQALESGTRARVLEVELPSGERVMVPRANVELIEG
ncbi:MAG: glutamate mutase L [Planctomycetota bacterium]